MNTLQPNATNGLGTETPNAETLLKRVLAAVEQDRRRGRLELAIAIILSLTTLATTWCGYQGRLWGGVQSTMQAAADTAERKAAEVTIVAFQVRTMDGITMIEYWAALREQDVGTSEAMFARMPPRLRAAIEASVAAGVLHDPSVPGPFQRPEYFLTEEEEAQRLREEAGQLKNDAQEAGEAAGSYVLLTLMFASVLFFGGITGTFTARRVRIGLAWIALALFIITTTMLIGLPVCKG